MSSLSGHWHAGNGTRGMHDAHRTLQGGRVLIKDCIELRVADVGVLCVQRVAAHGLLGPGQLGIRTAPGESVVTYAQNDPLLTDNACAYLPISTTYFSSMCPHYQVLIRTHAVALGQHLFVGILGPLCTQEGHRHEVVIPAKIPEQGARVTILPALWAYCVLLDTIKYGQICPTPLLAAGRKGRASGHACRQCSLITCCMVRTAVHRLQQTCQLMLVWLPGSLSVLPSAVLL